MKTLTGGSADPEPEHLGHQAEFPPKSALDNLPADQRAAPALVDETAEPVSTPDTPDVPFMGHQDEHPPKPIVPDED